MYYLNYVPQSDTGKPYLGKNILAYRIERACMDENGLSNAHRSIEAEAQKNNKTFQDMLSRVTNWYYNYNKMSPLAEDQKIISEMGYTLTKALGVAAAENKDNEDITKTSQEKEHTQENSAIEQGKHAEFLLNQEQILEDWKLILKVISKVLEHQKFQTNVPGDKKPSMGARVWYYLIMHLLMYANKNEWYLDILVEDDVLSRSKALTDDINIKVLSSNKVRGKVMERIVDAYVANNPKLISREVLELRLYQLLSVADITKPLTVNHRIGLEPNQLKTVADIEIDENNMLIECKPYHIEKICEELAELGYLSSHKFDENYIDGFQSYEAWLVADTDKFKEYDIQEVEKGIIPGAPEILLDVAKYTGVDFTHEEENTIIAKIGSVFNVNGTDNAYRASLNNKTKWRLLSSNNEVKYSQSQYLLDDAIYKIVGHKSYLIDLNLKQFLSDYKSVSKLHSNPETFIYDELTKSIDMNDQELIQKMEIATIRLDYELKDKLNTSIETLFNIVIGDFIGEVPNLDDANGLENKSKRVPPMLSVIDSSIYRGQSDVIKNELGTLIEIEPVVTFAGYPVILEINIYEDMLGNSPTRVALLHDNVVLTPTEIHLVIPHKDLGIKYFKSIAKIKREKLKEI